jgi:pimeloyl-ACP methyl ester carboxylesterase
LQIKRAARTRELTLLNRRVYLREWGSSGAPMIVMIHGWMDTSATFQFLVDALAKEWYVVAPDLRGFGRTQFGRESVTGYWFHDYLADLDALLYFLAAENSTKTSQTAPQVSPVNLLGHSLGGNIVCIYAGIRPERIRRLISLDGFGVPRGKADQAPSKAAKWLDALRAGEVLRPYATLEAVAQRLQKNDRFLTTARAAWLAEQWTERLPDGSFLLRADPSHKLPFPTVYRLEETIAIWKKITAPTLWMGAAESQVAQWLGYGRDHPDEMGRESLHTPEFVERLEAFASLKFEYVNDASHMLHHDRPEYVAGVVEAFLD